jgi:hypothetical protein
VTRKKVPKALSSRCHWASVGTRRGRSLTR